MKEVFHVLHKCGHSTYWSDGWYGMLVSAWPCPYCGGERPLHPKLPSDANFVRQSPPRGNCKDDYIFRWLNEDGSVPTDDPSASDEPIVVRHMTGDVCCNPPRPWRKPWRA